MNGHRVQSREKKERGRDGEREKEGEPQRNVESGSSGLGKIACKALKTFHFLASGGFLAVFLLELQVFIFKCCLWHAIAPIVMQ